MKNTFMIIVFLVPFVSFCSNYWFVFIIHRLHRFPQIISNT
jgi:hypothetical protein